MPDGPVHPLTAAEIQAFAGYEATIAAGLQTFVAVGQALLAIRDQRLYRHDYATFEAYCTERWGMSRPRAYQLMEAANVVGHLSTIVDTPLPANEAQARPLTALPPDVQRVIWQEAVATAPNGITAAHVQ